MKIFSQQLPDLDKVLRDLVDRVTGADTKKKQARAFSRDNDSDPSNGGGGSDSEPPNKGRKGPNDPNDLGDHDEHDDGNEGVGIVLPPLNYLLILCSLAVVLLWALFGFFTVDASERAVMFRLGNPNGIKSPGLAWHMPLIEDYRIVNLTEIRRVEVGFRNEAKRKDLRESLMLTGDLNIIDMQFVVQYALSDPERFLFENRFANRRAEDVVKQVAETSMREVVGKSDIDFVLYEGREAIAIETKDAMQGILTRYKTGINVREVAIQNVQPPDQVQDAFEDAIRARKDKDRKVNEGKAYANDILPRSQGQAARLLEDGEAYRQSTIARARGDAARFLLIAAEYERTPEITRRRLYLETLEEVMGRARKVILDTPPDSGNLLYLPLDKLLSAGGAVTPNINILPSTGGDAALPRLPIAPDNLDELKRRIRQGVRNGIESIGGNQ